MESDIKNKSVVFNSQLLSSVWLCFFVGYILIGIYKAYKWVFGASKNGTIGLSGTFLLIAIIWPWVVLIKQISLFPRVYVSQFNVSGNIKKINVLANTREEAFLKSHVYASKLYGDCIYRNVDSFIRLYKKYGCARN